MADLTTEQLLDLVDDTLSWGDNISERWTGTLYEKHIEAQKELIKESIRMKDLDRVRVLLFELAQFLDQSERDYESTI